MSLTFLSLELVKFFGILSRHQPKELSEKYPAFLQCCFRLLESCETSLLNIAVETIGFVGSSTDGKRALNKQGRKHAGGLPVLLVFPKCKALLNHKLSLGL